MSPSAAYYPAAIALGSNLGDRHAHLEAAFTALAALPQTRLTARGPILETAAVPRPGTTADPGGPYLNSAALIETTLDPHTLLLELHAIERSRGRDRASESPNAWSPRTLDLDLLLYADHIITTPTLTLPHPRMHERRFVLQPLAAIAPEWRVPTQGDKTVLQLFTKMCKFGK